VLKSAGHPILKEEHVNSDEGSRRAFMLKTLAKVIESADYRAPDRSPRDTTARACCLACLLAMMASEDQTLGRHFGEPSHLFRSPRQCSLFDPRCRIAPARRRRPRQEREAAAWQLAELQMRGRVGFKSLEAAN